MRCHSVGLSVSAAAPRSDFFTARSFPKLYHSLTASRHGRAPPIYRRCAMWLPPFLKRGIHVLGEGTKVLGLKDSVFLNRFHLPIIGNPAGIVNSHESNAVTL